MNANTTDNLILGRTREPTMEQIEAYYAPEIAPLWRELLQAMQACHAAKHEIMYSVCAGKPGWNVKLRAKGKALCTLYPDPDRFTALVVLGESACEAFSLLRDSFGVSLRALFDRTRLMNGTKWLMVEVRDESSLRDVLRLIELRVDSLAKK